MNGNGKQLSVAKRNYLHLMQAGLPVAVIVLATVLMMDHARKAEYQHIKAEFYGSSNNISSGLFETFQAHQDVVQSVVSLFTSIESTDRQEFSAFVHHPIKKFSGIKALEWIPRVRPDERDQYESEARQDGLSDFVFKDWASDGTWTAADDSDDDYFPVYFLQPHAENAAALGIDLASNPTRRQALELSRDSGKPVATARITLAQDSSNQAGFLLFVPSFEAGKSIDTVQKRRAHLTGFGLGVFRVDDLVNAVLARRSMDEMELRIFDISDEDDSRQPLYGEPSRDARQIALTKSIPYEINGRRWELEFSATPAYVASRSGTEQYMIGGTGLLLSVLMAAFVSSLIRRSAEVRVLVDQRTSELQEATKAANVAKSRFLSNMSHEIRTPLTAILGFVDLVAEEDVATDEGRDRVATIRRNGEHLQTLIDDILDVSKIDAGQLRIEWVDVEIVSLIDDVLRLLGDRAAAKGLNLSADFTTPIPQRIVSDPTRLRQILVNLAGNAIKFTNHGSVTLRIAFVPDDHNAVDGHGVLKIDVVDTGIGMKTEQTDRIFQPFTQADETVTRNFGGTGLGLTISRDLAQMLGGDLTVESQLRKGSTFSVSVKANLPAGVALVEKLNLDAASNDSMPRPQASLDCNSPNLDAVPGDEQQKRSIRVLLAEDGLDNQRLISFILRKAGIDVTIVDNGEKAVESAEACDEPFDVILMDMQMPVMDGYKATEQLRADGYWRPIVALTANAMTGDTNLCLEAGCDDYSTKPIDRKQLLALIEEYSRPFLSTCKQ